MFILLSFLNIYVHIFSFCQYFFLNYNIAQWISDIMDTFLLIYLKQLNFSFIDKTWPSQKVIFPIDFSVPQN